MKPNYVHPHHRAAPDGSPFSNYNYPGRFTSRGSLYLERCYNKKHRFLYSTEVKPIHIEVRDDQSDEASNS